MSTRKWKLTSVTLWGGAGLILLGMVLAYPRIVPFVETFLYTPHIPTAPPFAIVTPTQASNPVAALPAEVEPTVEVAEVTPPSTPEPDVTLAAPPEPEPTATPTAIWTGTMPTNIVIPSIDLDAPVVSIGWKIEKVEGQDQAVWDVPDRRAAGWHDTSGPLGVTGNAVLNGHNTLNGEVFRYLYRVEIGAQIFVEGKD